MKRSTSRIGEPIMLEVIKLEVVYNQAVMSIQGVSIRVPEGHIVTVLGTNGAGKTTLLRSVSGFLPSEYARISDGRILLDGEEITSLPPHRTARKGIVLVPERNKTFPTMSTGENIRCSFSRNRRGPFTPEAVYGYFPILRNRAAQTAGYLSGGERQMLALGCALLCQPRLLLIDEFSLGLARLVVASLAETLLKMKREQGLTLLLVEQNAAVALGMSDYAYVMETGRVVFDGPPRKLMAHEDVKEFYLGIKDGKKSCYRDVKQYRRTRRWWG
ncbi:MAG: ABC transporter ATP-binding protein [Thermodesulfobacteriota bacterium]